MSKNKKKIDTAIQEKILLQTYRAYIKKEGPGQTRTIIQHIKNNAKNYQLLDNAKKTTLKRYTQSLIVLPQRIELKLNRHPR